MRMRWPPVLFLRCLSASFAVLSAERKSGAPPDAASPCSDASSFAESSVAETSSRAEESVQQMMPTEDSGCALRFASMVICAASIMHASRVGS